MTALFLEMYAGCIDPVWLNVQFLVVFQDFCSTIFLWLLLIVDLLCFFSQILFLNKINCSLRSYLVHLFKITSQNKLPPRPLVLSNPLFGRASYFQTRSELFVCDINHVAEKLPHRCQQPQSFWVYYPSNSPTQWRTPFNFHIPQTGSSSQNLYSDLLPRDSVHP